MIQGLRTRCARPCPGYLLSAPDGVRYLLAAPSALLYAGEANDLDVNLKGTWTGTYGPMNFATKLVINNHNGTKLDGVLEQGSVRVAFSGTYDPSSRAVRLQQTELLQGQDWSLGEDVGTLSADGKKLSGSGKDAVGGMLGISYNWTFKRP